MDIKTTRELMDAFFATHENDRVGSMRKQVDRPEVYDYLAAKGKELVDLNVDELFEMIKTFNAKEKKNARGSKFYNSYGHISYLFKSIFNFYIDNVRVIKNPFYDPRMKGAAADKYLSEDKEVLTWEYVESVIREMRGDVDEDRADYVECIIQLFYNGFYSAEEIINLENDDVNLMNKTVWLNGRTVKLSDRCFELLVRIHNLTEISALRGNYIMAAWHGKYFKYPIRPNNEYEFNDRTLTDMTVFINAQLQKFINKPYETKLNYRNLYHLGFFDFVVGKVGLERASEICSSRTSITRTQSRLDADELRSYAMEYGAKFDNISHLKRALQPYIDAQYLE